eukprot:2602009-Prymnesium_polylepis.1
MGRFPTWYSTRVGSFVLWCSMLRVSMLADALPHLVVGGQRRAIFLTLIPTSGTGSCCEWFGQKRHKSDILRCNLAGSAALQTPSVFRGILRWFLLN